jgi:hypothetical protein
MGFAMDMLCALGSAVIAFPFGKFLLAHGAETSQAKSGSKAM